MRTIHARNVHDALPMGLDLLAVEGKEMKSRAGDVIELLSPVTTTYSSPLERCIFYQERDWSPFFFFMESLWMLAGRNDVEWLLPYNKRMAEYSDDGKKFHGAYGYRWRYHWSFDQLEKTIKHLEKNPDSRRAVITMWDPSYDLIVDETVGKDYPCNTQVYFWIRNEQLHMTVTNRSNDIIWGLYGANAVHFSFLQEYMAGKLGLEVGLYHHVSNNFHAYKDVFEKYKCIRDYAPDPYRTVQKASPYYQRKNFVYPLMDEPDKFDDDLKYFMDGKFKLDKFHNPFFKEIALPMWYAHLAYRGYGYISEKEKFDETRNYIDLMPDCDWRLACQIWLDRREQNFITKQVDNDAKTKDH